MARILTVFIIALALGLSGCQYATKQHDGMEQQSMATCGDPHGSGPSSQWQGCSYNRDCTQTCGSGWSCYSSSDGYCHNH